jgi:hypothetical protein
MVVMYISFGHAQSLNHTFETSLFLLRCRLWPFIARDPSPPATADAIDSSNVTSATLPPIMADSLNFVMFVVFWMLFPHTNFVWVVLWLVGFVWMCDTTWSWIFVLLLWKTSLYPSFIWLSLMLVTSPYFLILALFTVLYS